MSSVSICWSCSEVAGWYQYNFTPGDVCPVPARCAKQWKKCLGAEPCFWFGALERDDGARMAAATERVKIKTARAVSEERRELNLDVG